MTSTKSPRIVRAGDKTEQGFATRCSRRNALFVVCLNRPRNISRRRGLCPSHQLTAVPCGRDTGSGHGPPKADERGHLRRLNARPSRSRRKTWDRSLTKLKGLGAQSAWCSCLLEFQWCWLTTNQELFAGVRHVSGSLPWQSRFDSPGIAVRTLVAISLLAFRGGGGSRSEHISDAGTSGPRPGSADGYLNGEG